ncbi:sugar transferase [Geodermatophilus sp. DF01-2]|uniref:sugar transferase n=1 Tax=Geodermatophilus sp. DF01-2 TaxID=2559610 RepID=UPI00107300BC|nr:sugar transferase [Geodermatophilus sp. DF01_2]TFV64672.1 sugar transferase [Geodermatophilus sp. DF01_2]
MSVLGERHEVIGHRRPSATRHAGTESRRWPSALPWLRGEGTVARRAWRSAYVRRVAVVDTMAATVAALVAYLVRFGSAGTSPSEQPSLLMATLLPVVWVGAMLAARSYEERFLWVGPEEFRRVFGAAVLLLASVGTVSWAFQLELARGFVVIALPLATVLTLLTRYGQRAWLHRRRAEGQFQQTAIIVGHRSGVAALHAQIDREAYHGYRVIGSCMPGGRLADVATTFDGLPVLGGLDDVVEVVRRYEVDTVAVLPSPELDGPALRRLGWELEETRAELLLAPAVTEIVGPRVRIRPVCGLPLLHMERPELRGLRRVTKETFDRTAAALGVLVILPVLVTLGLAVGLTSRGGVFYRQERVGRDGQTFPMLKFRTMVPGADQMLSDLLARSDGNGVLFKMKDDPRTTRVGRFLRRYSLDELPQLFNVVRGDMSLVGPRPPLQSEVERYGFDMHRRFLVKPGITGLWQVSGRSDLSWEDSVRMDVRYVENWSLTFDFMILWKTLGAVLRGTGC